MLSYFKNYFGFILFLFLSESPFETCIYYKCYISERKGILAVGRQGIPKSYHPTNLTQNNFWERHKRVFAFAWKKSSKELNRTSALYRVFGGRKTSPGWPDLEASSRIAVILWPELVGKLMN